MIASFKSPIRVMALAGGLVAVVLGTTVVSAPVKAMGTSPATTGGMTKKPEGRPCFHADQVNGFNTIDRETVILTAGVRDRYLVKVMGYCPDLDSSFQIGIRSRGASFVCGAGDADLIVRDPIRGANECRISDVRKLTEDEFKALTEKKPKS